MTFSVLDLLGTLIVYQSLVFVVLLSFDRRSKPLFLRVLMGICLVIGLHFAYMFAERIWLAHPLFLGPVFGLLYGPAYYLYTRSMTDREVSPRHFAPHFLPALLTLVVVLMAAPWIAEIIPWVGLLVTLHYSAYLASGLRTIFRFRKRLKQEASTIERIDLWWLEVIIYLQVVVLLITLLESIYQSIGVSEPFIICIYGLVLVLIHCFYHLGLRQVRRFAGISPDTPVSEYQLAEAPFADYRSRLENYLEQAEPYLDFELTLEDLATALDISKRNLSHVINRAYGKNYYDFINSFRLERAKVALEADDAPIKTVMYDSGFASKASFNAVFKKETGLTPTQYRRSRQKGAGNA